MYRILQYGNGKYFVQKKGRYGWFRIGNTYNWKSSAEAYIERDKIRWAPLHPRVVAYY